MTLSTPLTTIYCREIQPTERHNRAQVERHAIAELVAEAFGSDAIYSHHTDGAPLVEGREEAISVSHCRGLATLAVSRAASVGIDAETPRVQLQRVSEKFLNRAEGRPTDLGTLLRLWTAKEAVYKAARTPGLSLTDIIVSTDHATALGHNYSITFFEITPALVAVAEQD